MSKTKLLIDELIKLKARGNNFQVYNIKMKLMLKGVMVDNVSDTTPDSPEIISRIYQVAKDFNIELPRI